MWLLCDTFKVQLKLFQWLFELQSPISNSSFQTTRSAFSQAYSSRMLRDSPLCYVHTSLDSNRSTRPHKTISREHPASWGRWSLLVPEASWACLLQLRRHKRWMIAHSSFSWNRLSATEVSMVVRCLSASGCTSVSSHRFFTGIKNIRQPEKLFLGNIWDVATWCSLLSSELKWKCEFCLHRRPNEIH